MARPCIFIALLAGLLLTACDKTPDEDACYAPGKNLETAYEPDAVGCECQPNTPGVCDEGVGLICEAGHWQAVIDGPCFPGPGEPCGEGLCSRYGYCDENADAGPQCEAKQAEGAACSENKQCLSETCTDRVCR